MNHGSHPRSARHIVRCAVASLFLSIVLTSASISVPFGNFSHVLQPQRAFAQDLLFTNVSVDPDVVPNKQFNVSATVYNSGPDSRQVQVAISVPADVSVMGSVIKDLGT